MIRIPDCPAPERVMTVLTKNEEVCANVLEQALPYMSEEAVSKVVDFFSVPM